MKFEERFSVYVLIARRLKALADPTRLAIIHSLCKDEINVTSMVEITGFSQARISKHLRILREEKLVTSRQEQRRIYYRLNNDFPRRICELVFESLECSNDDDRELLKRYEESF